jgi:hypothetical protein
MAARYDEMLAAKTRFDALVSTVDNPAPPAGPSNAEWFITETEIHLLAHPDAPFETEKDTFAARILGERTIGGSEFSTYLANSLAQKSQTASEKIAAETAFNLLSDAVATARSNQTVAAQVRADAWVTLFSSPTSAYTMLYAACPTFEVSHGYAFPPTY